MPCYGPDPSQEEIQRSYYRDFEHNSPVAEMLCGLMRQHEAAKHKPVYLAISPALAKWWEAHLRRDQARQKAADSAKAKKDAKAKALAKLSPADRKALGIKP